MPDFPDLRRRPFAAAYARTERRLRRSTARAREQLLGDLSGDVLEIGAGTGGNFGYYPADVSVVATDQNVHMLRRAGPEADSAAAAIEVEVADVTALPYPDATFDAVVATTRALLGGRPAGSPRGDPPRTQAGRITAPPRARAL